MVEQILVGADGVVDGNMVDGVDPQVHRDDTIGAAKGVEAVYIGASGCESAESVVVIDLSVTDCVI